MRCGCYGRWPSRGNLHQTCIRGQGYGVEPFIIEMRPYEDLEEPLAEVAAGGPVGDEWRVHFHVPLHIERLGGRVAGAGRWRRRGRR